MQKQISEFSCPTVLDFLTLFHEFGHDCMLYTHKNKHQHSNISGQFHPCSEKLCE